MKKAKRRQHRPPKPKRRAKPKEQPQAKRPPPASTAPSPASLFSSAFDFAGPADPVAGLISRAASALLGGNQHKALALCREALAADPSNADAFNLAGVASFQMGLADDALGLLQTAVAHAPGHAEAQSNLGNVLTRLGRVSDAARAYEAALAADPDYAEAAFNYGVLMEASGRPAEAVAAYERTLRNDPDHAAARQGLGNVLKALGRLDEARRMYQAALTRNPALPDTRTNLAAVLQELGDFEGAAEQCRQALEVKPDLIEARYNLAIALQELGRYREAIEGYREVLSAEPGHAAAALNIAYGLQQMGRLDEAAEAFERTLELDPDFAKAHANLADLRLQQGDPAAARAVCDAFLERHPGNTDLLAVKAVALWDEGREEEARRLVDFDRFLRPVRVATPPGYEDLAAFNAALSAHVEAHPTLTYAPQSHATRKGRHSGELLAEPKGPIADLERAILAAAQAYRRDLGRDPAHPFLAAPPERLTLSIWGVVMQAAGHQIPHIHPAAWLSGVYYPKLPDIVGQANGEKAGWIEFGRPPGHFHNRVAPEIRSIRPEPGLMVLFPSYFFHQTVPFETDETRISIAFDLMPEGPRPVG